MMKQITRTRHETDFDGRIFVITQIDIVDAQGNVTHEGTPHRVPYEPGGPKPKDEMGAAIAGAIWTKELVQTFQAQQAALKKEREAARAADQKIFEAAQKAKR